MRKIFFAALVIAATLGLAMAQDTSASMQQNMDNPPNMGRAPREPNGIGRLDLRVVDESGQPIKGAYARLESTRTDGFFCESWGPTDMRGVVVLPPIHMGALKLVVKAKGYKTQEIDVDTSAVGEPVRVTMLRKKAKEFRAR